MIPPLLRLTTSLAKASLSSSPSRMPVPSQLPEFKAFKERLANEVDIIRNDLFYDASFLNEADAAFAEAEIQRELDSYFSSRDALVRLYRERLLLVSLGRRTDDVGVGESEVAPRRGFHASSISLKSKTEHHPSQKPQ